MINKKLLHSNDKILFQGVRQCGMTTEMIDFMLDYAIANEESLIYFISHDINWSKNVLFSMCKELHEEFIINYNNLNLTVNLLNGSKIRVVPSKYSFKSARYKDEYPNLIVFDNAQFINYNDVKRIAGEWEHFKHIKQTHKIIISSTGINNKIPNAFMELWFSGRFYNMTEKNCHEDIDLSAMYENLGEKLFENEFMCKIEMIGDNER